jgi:hypothetical protein
MANLGYHIRLRLTDNRVIAPTARERRILSRVVLEQGRRDNLYVFDCPDSHLHVAARCDRDAAGSLTHRMGSGLKQRLHLPVGFVQYPPKPIEDNRHLYQTTRYILSQREHHGLAPDPRSEGSSLADLLGLRIVGRYTIRNIQRWLPRLRRRDLVDLSGMSDVLDVIGEPAMHLADTPLTPEILRTALQAAGCLTDLCGNSRELVILRAAAIAAINAVEPHLPAPRVAALLDIDKRTVFRLRGTQPDPDLVQAIELQLKIGFHLRNQSKIP